MAEGAAAEHAKKAATAKVESVRFIFVS